MGGEERLTEKAVAVDVLPKVTEAKEALKAHLAGLVYLFDEVDHLPCEERQRRLVKVRNAVSYLILAEDILCRI